MVVLTMFASILLIVLGLYFVGGALKRYMRDEFYDDTTGKIAMVLTRIVLAIIGSAALSIGMYFLIEAIKSL